MILGSFLFDVVIFGRMLEIYIPFGGEADLLSKIHPERFFAIRSLLLSFNFASIILAVWTLALQV